MRVLAVDLIAGVLRHARSLDEGLASAFARPEIAALEPRDRAFAYLIASTVLRRYGELSAVIAHCLDKPLPAKRGAAMEILLAGAAQLLILETPAHAAINLAVTQSKQDAQTNRFNRLINAVLRRITREGADVLAGLDRVRSNIPDWLWRRWCEEYGDETARKIADASLKEAALDLSMRTQAEDWAEQLNAVVLPTGSLRLKAAGRIEELPGFSEGRWWVQDAAAALPARLLGDVTGQRVLDLCAAPGGKTAQLASAGANVTSVDNAASRMERFRANLDRLQLSAELVIADAAAYHSNEPFDAVLLDAPCTATGTIRRHPDILHLKRSADIEKLAKLQSGLLDAASRMLKPGGTLVYCTCSLEPEEGERQVDRFLARNTNFQRHAISAGELNTPPDWITPDGDLRTLPFHLPEMKDRDSNAVPGIDGFFAARLRYAP